MSKGKNDRLVGYMRSNGIAGVRDTDGHGAIEDLAAAGLITPAQRRRARKKVLGQARRDKAALAIMGDKLVKVLP